MSKIDSWVTKVPRLKNSKVARFSYKAEAYANDNIEGVDSYDYSRDMNIPLATHTDFDASVLSSGARANFSSVPKNGLNHFFGRVSYNLNKVIDFLSDFLDDFRVQGVETVASSVAITLAAYYSGKKLRLVNTHTTNSILFTFYAGQTFKGSSTVIIPADTILELELIGTTWLHVSDFTESTPTPWAQYSGKDIPQLPDNVAGTTQKVTEFTSIPSGWGQNGVTPATSSFSDGEWKIIADGNAEGFTRQLPAGQIFIIDIKCLAGAVTIYKGGNLRTYTVTSNWNRFVYYNAGATEGIIMVSDSGTWLVKSIYIGTGAYDRLVFDNSYHYRHLLNNAVVPTPQGLYFNGATSYLRSKDKVTLPDVFTFRAVVNCAIKSTSQVFIGIGSYGNPSVPFIWILRNTNGYNLLIPVSNGTAQILTANFVNYFSGYENSDVDLKVEVDFVNKTIKAYRNGIQFGSVISSPTMVKPSSDYAYIGRAVSAEFLLGYMRNIQLFDTALTDTQRNWLAQGNTPPILYDVTNYETEGYVSIQDADGTNTGVETDVDSNGNRILKLPATIKATLSGNADTATQALAIKPLGNSITIPAVAAPVTKIVKIATVNWTYNGTINIACYGNSIEDVIKVYIGGSHSSQSGIRVICNKLNINNGLKKIIVTRVIPSLDSSRNIYAEIVTSPNNASTTTLGIIETNRGAFTPSMTEVASVDGIVLDSLSLDYYRGDISSYQHEFTKNIIGNLTGNVTGNADTADKWKTARNISISDADGTNTGTAVVVDGSEDETLTLPATIKATLSGNVSGSAGNVNSTNFFLNEDANYVNLHTKNNKPLFLSTGNVAVNIYGNPVFIGEAGQKVGILTANSSLYQPSAAYPVSIGENVHMNNKTIDNASRFSCFNNGKGDISMTTARGELTGYPNDFHPIIKTSHTTINFDIASTYAFALISSSGTTTISAGTNTKLSSSSPFYGAVGNDICDNIEIETPTVEKFEYGYCYCEDGDGYRKGNKGIIGITSDTASFHCGSDEGMEAGKDYLPIAIGGFVLAYVDKKYRRGTPLTPNESGVLTMATEDTPSWEIIATYQFIPKKDPWNKAKVNGRVVVRIK